MKNDTNYVALGIPLGMLFGMVLGTLINNLPIGMCFGMFIGTTVGSLLNKKYKKTVTKEMSDEEIKIVEQLIRQKEDIKAIKKIREYTNLDLVSAKNLFEEMKKRNNL